MDKDSKFTRDEEGYMAVRVVSGTEALPAIDKDYMFARDENGNIAVRVVGAGGGSDQHNLGYYETLSDLETAHPTGEAGDWAIVAESDTVYIWDATQGAWIDTDRKGQVTSVNGQTGSVVLNATDVEAIPQYTSMPLANSNNANSIVQYKGTTNSNYTNGYFYKNVANIIYTGTVSFEAASLSGTTVACSGDNFANFLTESGVSPLSVVSGTMTYDAAGSLWVLVGKNASNETVLTFQEYQEDYEDFGFTFTGTPQDGDVIAFTCTVQEASASYAWTRIDVQPMPEIPDPLPDQTGQSGKFLITDGTDASWSDKPLVNKATGTNSLSIDKANIATQARCVNIGAFTRGGEDTVKVGYAAGGSAENTKRNTMIGSYTEAVNDANEAICIGWKAASGTGGVSIGSHAQANLGNMQIVINKTEGIRPIANPDINTVKIANANGNFEIMSADGTIPKERLTNLITTPSTMPELTVADWSNNTQTVTVTGVTATNTVFVSPAPQSSADYVAAGIVCTAQGTDSLTFTCNVVPTNAITVNVVIFG